MKRLITLSFVLLAAIVIIAQPICQVKHFSVSDGLAQGVVMSILQDRKGLVWFSTWNGLNKFDGYTFKTYKTSQESAYAFGSNRMGIISESRYGDIWCPTYDGQACLFDVETEKFIDVLQPIERSTKQTNYVTRIYSLKKGIAWILCENGYAFRVDEQLCKKGEGITLYATSSHNLKGDQIVNVYQDSEEDEWILTDKGISIIGKKTLDTDFPFQFITQIKETIYLIAENDKLAKYDFHTKKLKFVDIPYPHGKINNVTALGKEMLALGTDNGLILYSTREDSFRQIDIRTATQLSNYVETVYQDHLGELWIFSKDPGIIHINLTTNEKEHLFTPKDEIIKHGRKSRKLIFEDKAENLWLLPTEGNFCYYDRKEKTLKPLLTDINNPKSIFSPLVRSYTLDNQGNCWFATARGVEKLCFFPQSYQFNLTDYEAETRAFLRDSNNRLWTASKSNYIQIYAPDGTLEGYLSAQGNIVKEKQPFYNGVYSILEDKNNNIWLGTKDIGLFQLRKTGTNHYSIHHFEHQPDNPYSLSSNSIYAIYQDSRNHIWVGCYGGGLNLLTQAKDGKISFIHGNNELRNYPIAYGMKVRNIAEAPGGVILVGTTNGLLTFSNNFERLEEIKFYRNIRRPGDKNSLSANDIMHIYTDKNQTTYIISFTGGVNKVISENLLSENIQFKNYDKNNGLASDLALSMIEDTQNQLWVVSEIALSKFNPVKETFENYELSSIYQEFNFSEAIPVINARNQIVLGTDKGFLEVSPEKMHKSGYVPPIVFTGLKIQGHSTDYSIDNLKELELEPSQRNVTFQFAALDYVNPKGILYAYRLQGLEEEWNEADNNRSASYINLPAGKYQLQVKSTNSDGVWTDNIRTMSVHVLPTFWETYWAWLLYFVLFILFTATIVYVLFYIYRLRHRVDMEQQLANIKLRFFTDISHELRTPLTLISSPVTEVLENEPLSPSAREHLTLVHQNTERMLRLMNQILDFRKIQNQKMKLLIEETDLVPLLQKVMNSFRLIAEEKHINYRLHTKVESVYSWVDRDKFEKIFFNLLSNAFKYTPADKSITVSISTKEKAVEIEVADEGIGIAAEKQHSLFQRFESLVKQNILQPSSGIGLSLVKEMVEMHHGTIEVDSQPGTGSRFTVILPLQKEVFEEDGQVEFILNDSLDSTPHPADSMQAIEETEEKEEQERNSDNFSILVVEDNEELKAFLRNILSENYTVITASNGEEGLQRAADNLPDLIISDVMMPVMDGLEMVRLIKENNNICHIPIIVLSAKASLDDRIAGLEQGIDDYITKPFSATYLKTRIASLLRQRKALQEIYMNKLMEGKNSSSAAAPVADSLTPSQPQITPYDEQFMEKVMEFMEEQMDNAELTIDEFAEKLMLSRTIFYRKLKSIIGLTPVDFIREIRIKRAVQLIDSGEYNFSQVAYMTGFNDPKYFSKCFKKVIGITPSEYKEKKK
ncbi:hybrid sensor histidine kinase/response regulator transcription factor [Bacteroides congonensis]|uniref:hybrid sensor histidine kinase/response regulator transcription factor n=1 Tax=Bacteroides congonensis TaxID=1871006 RepID=UPI00189F3D6A|nr:hybrid sensor histidine kinase/response regulator transcription factor [Bacteroides congonensis]